MIDLSKLKHAVVVARAGSFSLAARNINISQSALTRSVKMLEETYSIVIFDRGKAGAKLTLEGAKFIQIAEAAIRRNQTFDDELKLSSLNAPCVTFGMGPMTAASLLPYSLQELSPGPVTYRIKIQPNSMMQLMLRQGDLDFFVGGMRKGSEIHALANQFSVERIGSATMSLMVRHGHPLIDRDLSPEALSRFPTAGGTFIRETFGIDTIQRIGLQEPSLELDDYSLLTPFILGSDHVLITSDIVANLRKNDELVKLPMDIDISEQSEWVIVSSSRDNVPAAVEHAIDVIREAARRLTETMPSSGQEQPTTKVRQTAPRQAQADCGLSFRLS